MPLKDNGFVVRAGTPRLRHYIERRVAELSTKKKGEAAEKLGLTPSELANFSGGARTPSAQKILDIVSAGNAASGRSDFLGTLDQQLIESGHAPVFFSQFVLLDETGLLLRKTGDCYVAGTFVPGEDLVSLFSNVRIAGGMAALQIARIEGDDIPSSYLLLEPTNDDTDLGEADIVLCTLQDQLLFARFARHKQRTSLTRIDPLTLQEGAAVKVVSSQKQEVLARVVLQFRPPAGVSANSQPRRPTIRSLERLQIGIAPFQDALLPIIGMELGFFEKEGLLLSPERIDWYNWTTFFKRGSDDLPKLVFANMFSFVKDYHLRPDLRYLYGVNLFDNGFEVLAKRDSVGQSENPLSNWARLLRGEECQIEISTVLESDWAAQLFSLCVQKKINLSFAWGRGTAPIYQTGESLVGRPTIVIRDTQSSGVEADPQSINEHSTSYLGSLPQRIRLKNEFNWAGVPNFKFESPFPINGFVGTSDMLHKHQDVLMRFLRVWFRIVNYIRPEIRHLIDSERQQDAQLGSKIVYEAFERNFPDRIAKLEVGTKSNRPNEVVQAWGNETFPRTPAQVEKQIFGESGHSEWKNDAGRAMEYLEALKPDEYNASRIDTWEPMSKYLQSTSPQSMNSPFALELVHKNYVDLYGKGELSRSSADLDRLPYPELLYAIRRR